MATDKFIQPAQNMPSFSDRRVFISQATDPTRFTEMQDADGPTHIVVGANVTDERLERHAPTMLARYGVTLAQLHQARDGVLGTYTPEDDGEPLQIHIGNNASTEALSRVANRHGLNLQELVSFRDALAEPQQARAGFTPA